MPGVPQTMSPPGPKIRHQGGARGVTGSCHRLRVRLQRAGHILGPAYVELDSLDRETGAAHRTLFSGDLGAPHAPLLPAPRAAARRATSAERRESLYR